MLEAVASYDLWIWHAYFGPAGSNNDINVLNQSDLFKELLEDRAPPYQESARKDIELAFGVLQGRFAIIKSPARQFYIEKIQYTCVILHNMITEDNGRAFCGLEEDYQPVRRSLSIKERFDTHLRMDKELRDSTIHRFLRDNLIEHIWSLPPNACIRHNPQAGPSAIPSMSMTMMKQDLRELITKTKRRTKRRTKTKTMSSLIL
ncbi:uncharacterized protein [Rutidosis leptorrhynchoides]|uniref:uncharacterized protein n=1 Tax=Rutidosis leptorrhynchoides TaxID=125765 RepID=UPI003A999643